MMNDDLLAVRGFDFVIHVLRDGGSLYVIDPGFQRGIAVLKKGLSARGWEGIPIKGILITHGHIDHILNVAQLVRETDACVAAPRLDRGHLEGSHVFTGASRVCGWLEAAAKVLLGHEAFAVDHWLDDGDELPIWGGLKAIHLPGHTVGHMGFLSEKRRLLFSGDLFASRGGGQLPPTVFNDRSELIPGSLVKALSLNLEGVMPYHCDTAAPGEHLERLGKLAKKLEPVL